MTIPSVASSFIGGTPAQAGSFSGHMLKQALQPLFPKTMKSYYSVVWIILYLEWHRLAEWVKAEEITISIDVVSGVAENYGEVHSYEHSVRPRDDVMVTTQFNWATVDPRDPFLSMRHILNRDSYEVDLCVLSVEWGLMSLLMTSLESTRSLTLLWHGGLAMEINSDVNREQNEGHSYCDVMDPQYQPAKLLPVSLFETFRALEDVHIKVLSELLGSLSWEHFIVVTDDYTGTHINSLLTIANNDKHQITQLHISQHVLDDDIHDRIAEAYKRSKNGRIHALVFCEIACVLRVVKKAQEFDDKMGGKTALSYMSSWVVVTLQEYKDRIERVLTNLNNIAVISPTVTSGVPVSMEIMKKLITEAVRETFTKSNLSYTTPDVGTNKSKYIQETIQCFVSKVRSLDRRVLCDQCPLFVIHTALWKTEGRQFTEVGQWFPERGLLFENYGVFPNKNFGFNNQTFRIATNMWPHFVTKDEETGEYGGLCMDLLLEISSKMNFSYVLYEPEDLEWGVLKEDGHWSGLVGELEHRWANLTVAPLSITADRELVADFAYPFYYDYNAVLIKKPDESKTKWRTLLDIFTYPVYIGIALSLPVMTLLIYLGEKFNPYYVEKGYKIRHRGFHNFQDTLWYMYGALLTQGGVFLPKSQTGRTLLSFWHLYSIILVATFSGNLIASLTVSTNKTPFDTLKEMLDQDEYKWGTTDGTYLTLLFQESNLSVYRRLWEGMKSFELEINSLSSNLTVHMEMVKNGGYAFMTDKSGTTEFITKECDLVFIKEEFFPMRYAIGLPNESPFTDMFSDQMLKILESGLFHIWKQKWWPKQNFCNKPVMAVAQSIALIDVQSAFYLLFIGATLGFLAVIIETLRKYCASSPENKFEPQCG